MSVAAPRAPSTGLARPALASVQGEISAISIAGFQRPASPRDGGPEPRLEWIEISALYVDSSYQRALTSEKSRKNIRNIAENFDWAFFTPVIVSPIEGGDFFCIIDGQHRTTAAKLIGKPTVPCCIVVASRAKQARAFATVNGNVTPVSANAKFHALCAAGDAEALALRAAMEEGGASVPRRPLPAKDMKPGETAALSTLKACLKEFGRETFVAACRAITRGPRQYVGIFGASMFRGLCMAIDGLDGSEPPDRVQARFDAIDLADIARGAAAESGRTGVKKQHLWVCLKLAEALVKGAA